MRDEKARLLAAGHVQMVESNGVEITEDIVSEMAVAARRLAPPTYELDEKETFVLRYRGWVRVYRTFRPGPTAKELAAAWVEDRLLKPDITSNELPTPDILNEIHAYLNFHGWSPALVGLPVQPKQSHSKQSHSKQSHLNEVTA